MLPIRIRHISRRYLMQGNSMRPATSSKPWLYLSSLGCLISGRFISAIGDGLLYGVVFLSAIDNGDCRLLHYQSLL